MTTIADSPPLFQETLVPEGCRLAGWAALKHTLDLQAPVRSKCCVSSSHIKGSQREEAEWTVYDKRYWPGDKAMDHLDFAFKREPLDLLVLKRIFDRLPERELIDFIQAAPTGAVSRRLWFFFEFLTGRTLDIPDLNAKVAATDALDAKAYVVSSPVMSKRHRVRDNLLGNGNFCPLIRRTDKIEAFLQVDLDLQAQTTIGNISQHLLRRAASFLLLADSQSSFAIEGERPARTRLERWGRAVLQAGKNRLSVDEFNRLHAVLIEDTRFNKFGLRDEGVFLGERDHNQDPLPEFIGARHEDLPQLIEGLLAANMRMRNSNVDAVMQATATAFGFVYIHPYEDGNGRLHRCLIHHVLAERKFTPPGMVFPVSAVMYDRIDDYRRVLQAHSSPLMEFIDWRPTAARNVEVLNDTRDLYALFDCTEVAEFLYECVERTVQHDLPKEIEYLRRHDEFQRRLRDLVEMPDKLAQDLLMFIENNNGKLPNKRRKKEFAALNDDEVAQIEQLYAEFYN